MAHMMLSTRLSTPICPRTSGLTQSARPVRTRLARAAVANDEPPVSKDGIVAGIAQWPPKPITEHGQPNPEDDPNPDADSGAGKPANDRERVAGPSEAELKKQEPNTSGLSESRPGGTQQGGGGEGSAS